MKHIKYHIASNTIFLSVLLFSGSLFAETLYMKDGSVLKGNIVGQSRTEVKISIDGKVRTIKKDAVKRIQYTKTPEEIQKEKEAAEKERILKEQRDAEERQRRVVEEEARKKAEAEKLKEDQKEKERLAKEEEKKQKQLAKEEKEKQQLLAEDEERKQKEEREKEKKEKISHLVNTHSLSMGIANGRANHHYLVEDVANASNKAMGFMFQSQPLKLEDTEMGIGNVFIYYNWHRFFVDLDVAAGVARPKLDYLKQNASPGESRYELLYIEEHYKEMKYTQTSSTLGYKLFLRDFIEISPILTFQKYALDGSSSVMGAGPGFNSSSGSYTATIISGSSVAYTGKTGMAGIDVKYKFSFPLEIDFRLQGRVTKIAFEMSSAELPDINPYSLYLTTFNTTGEAFLHGTDASLKTKYSFEKWGTSLFATVFGYGESGNFKKAVLTANFIPIYETGTSGGGPKAEQLTFLTWYIAREVKNNSAMHEKNRGIVFGVEQKIDFAD